jgi:hypothetical protein
MQVTLTSRSCLEVSLLPLTNRTTLFPDPAAVPGRASRKRTLARAAGQVSRSAQPGRSASLSPEMDWTMWVGRKGI